MSAAIVPADFKNLPPGTKDFSNGTTLLAQTTSVFAVALVVVIGRCYARIRIVESFGPDDWTMVLSCAMAAICCVCYIIQIQNGVGKYTAVIMADEAAFRVVSKARLIHMNAVVVGLSMVKVSVCFFLLRIARSKPYIWFLRGLIVFLLAFTLACMGTLDTRLRPPPFGTGNAKCFTFETFGRVGLFNGVVNIITDFVLAILPIHLIWSLQMNIRTRLVLVAVLSLGLFAAAAGIVRQSFMTKLDPEPWIHDSYAVWNFIELYAGIIAASLPAIKPLFGQFFEVVRAVTGVSTTKPTYRRDPTALGYHEPSSEGFVMRSWAASQLSGPKMAEGGGRRTQEFWTDVKATGSEEDILIRKPEGNICVTTKLEVTADQGAPKQC